MSNSADQGSDLPVPQAHESPSKSPLSTRNPSKTPTERLPSDTLVHGPLQKDPEAAQPSINGDAIIGEKSITTQTTDAAVNHQPVIVQPTADEDFVIDKQTVLVQDDTNAASELGGVGEPSSTEQTMPGCERAATAVSERDDNEEASDQAQTVENPNGDIAQHDIVASEQTEATSPEESRIDLQESDEEEEIVVRPRSRGKRPPASSLQEDEDSSAKRTKSDSADVEEELAPALPEKAFSTAPPSNDDDDEEGNTKVDADGALLGGRVYTSRAFRLPTRGDTYYFLATEIARVSGYRDSYLLFNKNRNLKKLMTTEVEKAFLIQEELIPYSYRNRQIGVVNALTIYKTFGSKIIVKGKRVKDDYFAQRARDQGFTENDFANEEDRPVEERMNEIAEAQRRAETEAEIALANNAKSAVDYNAMINQQRKARENARRQHFQNLWSQSGVLSV